ncbi:division/cell wall cluster transcriptional repressor MraZ [Jannaschia sp. M317]|uniref:division/cell wall cluster transcriptional repressor MraZ n=1 Tax=Jannaschia sp. M317 TaxID=2867011 RepID=UPI0021A891D6|nr:hypothetical protein [Jannaschia sp. M317]UWQ19326.1 hypothetical protein K3551_08705 [Jannaschia sp. M317]
MIPSEFRTVLDAGDPERPAGSNPSVHICYGEEEPWLSCWTVEAAEEIEAQIDALEYGDERDMLEECFFEKIEVVQLDDAGRMVIPKMIRDNYGLVGEAIFASRGKNFRLYSPEVPIMATSKVAQAKSELGGGTPILSVLSRAQVKAAS